MIIRKVYRRATARGDNASVKKALPLRLEVTTTTGMKLSLAKLLRKVIKQKNQPTKPKNATKEYKNGATVAQAETSETETDTG